MVVDEENQTVHWPTYCSLSFKTPSRHKYYTAALSSGLLQDGFLITDCFQVLSFPLNGQHRRLLSMGSSQSSQTCGRSASCSQSWSPRAECPIQVCVCVHDCAHLCVRVCVCVWRFKTVKILQYHIVINRTMLPACLSVSNQP